MGGGGTGRARFPSTSAKPAGLNGPLAASGGSVPRLLWHLSCIHCQKQSQLLPAPNTPPVCAGTDVPGSQLGKLIQMKPAQQIQPKYLAFAEISFPVLVCCVASWLFVLVSMWGEQADSIRLCIQDQYGLILPLRCSRN